MASASNDMVKLLVEHGSAVGSTNAVEAPKEHQSFEKHVTLKGHQDVITGLALENTGNRIITASQDGTIRFWSLKNLNSVVFERKFFGLGAYISTNWDGHNGSVQALAVSQNAEHAVTGGADGKVLFWSLKSQRCMYARSAHEFSVFCTDISANGDWTFSGGFDGKIRVWSTQTGTCRLNLGGHDSFVMSLCVSRLSMRWLVSGDALGTLKVWNLEINNQNVKCVEIQALSIYDKKPINCIAICPNDEWIVSAGDDKTIQVRSLKNLEVKPKIILGHKSFINALSVDKELIVSGSWDQQVRVWDLKTGDALYELSYNARISTVKHKVDKDTLQIFAGLGSGEIKISTLSNMLSQFACYKKCLADNKAPIGSEGLAKDKKSNTS